MRKLKVLFFLNVGKIPVTVPTASIPDIPSDIFSFVKSGCMFILSLKYMVNTKAYKIAYEVPIPAFVPKDLLSEGVLGLASQEITGTISIMDGGGNGKVGSCVVAVYVCTLYVIG